MDGRQPALSAADLRSLELDEQHVVSGVLNMARMWEGPARKMGRRWIRWDDAWAADSGLPTRMFNRVTVIRRLDPAAAPDLAERIIRFFGNRRVEGEYLINDPWGTLDLDSYGFKRWWTLPFMVRASADARRSPIDLEIAEVRSKSQIAAFVTALVEAFAISELTGISTLRVIDDRVLADGMMKCWVAFADGRPIGTSVAYHSDGVVGVYLVGVVPGMRRRGLGEALTWQATLSNAGVPSTLQASELGSPVYQRMGYVKALDCATWVKTDR